MRSLVLETAPTVEPVVSAEAKTWLKVTDSGDDTIIGDLCTSARQEVERGTGRALITRTYTLYLDSFPAEILLPMPPLQSITSIKYLDTAGTQQTLTAVTDYQVDVRSTPGRVMPARGKTWPSIYDDTYNPIEIEYEAGYGDAATDITDRELLTAIRQIITHSYENRDTSIVGTIVAKIPSSAEVIINSYKVNWI